jgi:hypothetical protein
LAPDEPPEELDESDELEDLSDDDLESEPDLLSDLDSSDDEPDLREPDEALSLRYQPLPLK